MNRELVRKIAAAVLYEGYMLYPYRPALKNCQRWTFGVLYPHAYSQVHAGDAWTMRTECLLRGDAHTRVEATARFLHLLARQVGRLATPLAHWPAHETPPFEAVPSLAVGDVLFHTWQEATEREAGPCAATLGDMACVPQQLAFRFPAHQETTPLCDAAGLAVGLVLRQQAAVEGVVEMSAEALAPGLWKLVVTAGNLTAFDDTSSNPGSDPREAALLRSLISTHLMLGVARGQFLSLMDPPGECCAAAAACHQQGVWPVLVGEEGQCDTMLAAPIILYDYPQIAPESPGDMFDGTEIDEILALRILTLTDDERRAMLNVDQRTRALLERTQALAEDQVLRLHGPIRTHSPQAVEP